MKTLTNEDGTVTTLLPESACPACDYKMDACTNLDGQSVPSEGDVSICFNCGAILEFTADLMLEMISEEKWEDLDADLVAELVELQKYVMLKGSSTLQ